MTHDIRKLITDIRTWEAADKAYKEADDAYEALGIQVHDYNLWVARADAIIALENSIPDFVALSVSDVLPSHHLLAAFVALADAYEAQAAALDELRTRIARIGDEHLGLYQMTMTTEWTLDVIEETLKAKLTGNDEGDA